MNLKAKKVIKTLVKDYNSGTIDYFTYTHLIKGAMSFYRLSAEKKRWLSLPDAYATIHKSFRNSMTSSPKT